MIDNNIKQELVLNNKIQLFNYLIQLNNYKTYLEIGYFKGDTFKHIKCEKKVAVDPAPLNIVDGLIVDTSDNFFIHNREVFDIIHIDGLHQSEQIERDIENSLKVLSSTGIIILHDMLPYKEAQQYREQALAPANIWTGDGWKAFLKLRQSRSDLTMFTIPIDFGLGIIFPGYQDIYIPLEEINSYKSFLKHKREAMNIKNPMLLDLLRVRHEEFYLYILENNLAYDLADRKELLEILKLSSREDLLNL